MPFKHKSRKTSYLAHQLLWSCCFLNLISERAIADELDTLQFRASVNKAYDDNLFKRSTAESSDQISRTTLGVKFDKTYSLQRVMLDFWVVDNKYQKNDFLDFVGKNYSATYQWTLTPSLTGRLSSRKTESMNNFGDYLISNKNIRTNIFNEFTAVYSPHKVWGIIFGISQAKVENSQIFTAITDFDAKALDYGVSYDFASGTSIKLLAHNRNGGMQKRPLDPVLAFDNGYQENEYEVNLFLPEQGKSKFSAKLGHIDRDYDHYSIRNWSAFVGYANYDLIITGKLRGNFSLNRAATPYETVNTTFSITDTFSSRLTYDLSSKIETGLNLRVAKRDFEGNGQFDTSGRNDKEHSFGGYVSWNPTKNIGVTLNSSKTYRDSTVDRFNYEDTLTYLNFELRI